ncbi:MAG: hypothetical protein R3F61_03125 [Myxococcota bacterium]
MAMWLAWIGGALAADGAEPQMWDRCVSEGLLSAEDHAILRKQLDANPPGSAAHKATIEAALARNEGCPALWMAAAGVHHAEGKPEKALEDLRKAAAAGPDWPQVQRALAVALHNDGMAGEVLDVAVDLNPTDGLLKILQAEERPPSERAGLMRDAVEAHPHDAEVAVAAVRALDEAGRPLEAIALARERYTVLDTPELAALVASMERPFEVDETERARRPGEFRTLPDGTEEVIVYSPARARQELENRLSAKGWTLTETIDGGIRYRTEKPVQPWVEIYDDGRVEVQESGKITPPEGTLPEGQTMIPYISARKLQKKRAKLMEDIWYEVTVWQQAQIRVSFQEQLGEHLPDLLTGIWERGEPMYGKGTLDSPEARRGALLDYWATRACSEDGDAARAVVQTFVRRVVQESETPASAEEIAAAQGKSTCEGRVLEVESE